MPVHGPGRDPFLNTAPDSAKKGKTGRPQSPSKRGSAAARLQLILAMSPRGVSTNAMISTDFLPPAEPHLLTRPLNPPLNMARLEDYVLRPETEPRRLHPPSTLCFATKGNPPPPRNFALACSENSRQM